MSRPWVDFIHIDEQPLQSCSNEFGIYNYREFADGTTRNEGKNSPIISPGKSIMLDLDKNSAIKSHAAPVMIRAFIYEGNIKLDGEEIKERTYIEIPIGSRVPNITSEEGARIFITYDGEYLISSEKAENSEIVIKYMQDIVWRSPIVSDFPGGAARKAFYDHDEYGSGILGILPEWKVLFMSGIPLAKRF